MFPARSARLAARPARGFTYIGLLFGIAVLGITLATVGIVWSTQIRRDREAELLFVGDQYRQAIGRYLRNGGQFPQDLSDLTEDKRAPEPRRHLRRLYPDPMTNSVDWDLITAPQGGIMGVASRSQDKPIKVAGFRGADSSFENAECYCNWKFVYSSRYIRARPVVRPDSAKP